MSLSMRARLALSVVLLAIAGGARAAGAAPWTAYADCAGAYQANAHVADAERPASMVSQMSDVAEDYAKAARAAYRKTAKSGAAAAEKAVAARIAATAQRLAKQPREAAEKLIDTCPQTES
jgi:hypothetical protein